MVNISAVAIGNNVLHEKDAWSCAEVRVLQCDSIFLIRVLVVMPCVGITGELGSKEGISLAFVSIKLFDVPFVVSALLFNKGWTLLVGAVCSLVPQGWFLLKDLDTKQGMILYTRVKDLTPPKVKKESGISNLVFQEKDMERHPHKMTGQPLPNSPIYWNVNIIPICLKRK